jgi:hypothetical protein
VKIMVANLDHCGIILVWDYLHGAGVSFHMIALKQ